MPSKLNNLMKKLTWNDFGTPVNKPAPPPGQTATGAHIETKAALRFGWETVPGTTQVRLRDNVTVTIQILPRPKTWVASWVFQQPKSFQDSLLNHEQGHYSITGLMGRDMFIDLMQLKSQTFNNSNELQQAVNGIAQQYQPQPVHTKYDSMAETNHGMKTPAQKNWDGFFQKAFSQARTPAVQAPDGALYKVRLIDVLKGAGKI